MTDTSTTPPIVVSASPTPAQISAGLRQFILVAASACASLGLSGVAGNLNAALAFVGIAGTIGSFLWGQFATRFHAKQAAALADMLPNTKAQTKMSGLLGWILAALKWLAELGSSPVATQAKETGAAEQQLKQERTDNAAVEKARDARDAPPSGVLDDPFNLDAKPKS